MPHQFKFLIVVMISLLIGQTIHAQSIPAALKKYSGEWINKKDNRHLSITIDSSTDITINDWTGKWKRKNTNIDAYRAWYENGKIILPADNEEHKAPYCELEIIDNKLHYRCLSLFDKENKAFVSEDIFEKKPK